MTPRIWWVSLGVRLNILSGTPYTPTVVGDINGDGRSNDRAFVANPANTADATLASQMTDLLAAAPAGARKCLQAQFGAIAGRNSCQTGWQLRADLNLNFTPPENLGVGNRLRVTTNLINTTGALVRLFGMENTALGRSSSSTTPDARLLYVTGFDPVSGRFQYRVNQLFGEPQDFGAARRRFAPFQVQVGLEYKLGGPPTSPMARALGLLVDKNAPQLTAEEVRQRLQVLSSDPLTPVLARAGSLAFRPDQIERLTTISREFRTKADSVSAPLVTWVVSKKAKVPDSELTDRISKLQPVLRRLQDQATSRAAEVLTAEQQAFFPKLFPNKSP